MSRWRYRLARRLVGPFVRLPEKDGVWVVQQVDGGSGVVVVEADKFRMRMQTSLQPFATFNDALPLGSFYPTTRRTGRFVGTVKYQ